MGFKQLKHGNTRNMVRTRRRIRQSISSTSSNEDSSPSHAKKRPNLGSTSEVESKDETETPSLGDVWRILKEIKVDTEILVQEVETLKGNYENLKDSLTFTQSQVKDLIQENLGLKSKVKTLENQVLKSKTAREELEQRVGELEIKYDDLEQYTRKFNLEIHGIPEREEEDNMENVMKLGHLSGVNISRDDVDIVHRLKKKTNGAPRPIIVRFSNYRAKNELYRALATTGLKTNFIEQARLNLKKINLQELNADKIFINENLTSWRANLFREERKVRRNYPNGKTWTIDGKIFLKTDINATVQRIDCFDDLNAL